MGPDPITHPSTQARPCTSILCVVQVDTGAPRDAHLYHQERTCHPQHSEMLKCHSGSTSRDWEERMSQASSEQLKQVGETSQTFSLSPVPHTHFK